jgi:hypothetical protein
VLNFPAARDRESLNIRELAAAYCITYRGRDRSKLARVEWWVAKLGAVRVVDLDADQIADLLDEFERERVMRFEGRDKGGRKVFETRGQRKQATINRQKTTLSSLITFAKDRWSGEMKSRRPAVLAPGLHRSCGSRTEANGYRTAVLDPHRFDPPRRTAPRRFLQCTM